MSSERKSGILLHITSLPGKWGMGELGPEARKFGEFLAACGQKLWQILPVNPIGYGYSAYSSSSAFAGNPLLISFDELIEEGLLTKRHLSRFPEFDPHKIDFPAVIDARVKILNGVCERFDDSADFKAFCKKESYWLDDYALFVTIRSAQNGAPWTDWPEALRDRDVHTLEKFGKQHVEEIRRHRVLQYLFARHWKKMREFFQTLEIEIIGDVPIFVAADSADVWAHRELFQLNKDGSSLVVAGVPPDYFSETGQRWGNPLYDWEVHRKTKYAWWTARMRRTFELVDKVRIDHFRGFESYWEIPAKEPTAIHGEWVQGPGVGFFQTLESNLRKVPMFGKTFQLAEHVIAEDLGIITDAVDELREACGFPGMTVLQFRFSPDDMRKDGYRPEGDEDRVVYTGTHDNETTRKWFKALDEKTSHEVRVYLHTHGDHIHRDLAELAMRSPARWAILPLQDVLGRGRRMNMPGTTTGNWDWRVSEDMITTGIAEFLKEMTERNGR
ncbi:4-alpha-glucanotransferase [Tichowtungia aerotolerans]|uniref:4-alpha-glucanotransferase n=1 Tax=Tichowtungia aerotolerans TaxID=2697043 RepID=A0A6P1M7X3_9BACT|nr:4-alpha-glucanotransferase [Tichowtungia aerotolerans]QHI70690.1 4-alpha-glucanotransferase [Tichowtungia aerotolerans]